MVGGGDFIRMTTYRVGVDVGGTFTDIVLLGDDGTVHTKKVSSSVRDYAQAIVDGLDELFRETGLSGAALEEIRHGTTVASNAILEHKGARTGLITTKGFRDVLEIRTLRMPRLYDMAWTKPPPLVERYLRRVVDERVDAEGRIERALARSTRCSPRRSRRSPSACSTPSPTRRTSWRSATSCSARRRACRCRCRARCCPRSRSTSAPRRRWSTPT
jgi:hypothetical protein